LKRKYPKLNDLLKSLNNGYASSEQHDLMVNGGISSGLLLNDGLIFEADSRTLSSSIDGNDNSLFSMGIG